MKWVKKNVEQVSFIKALANIEIVSAIHLENYFLFRLQNGSIHVHIEANEATTEISPSGHSLFITK